METPLHRVQSRFGISVCAFVPVPEDDESGWRLGTMFTRYDRLQKDLTISRMGYAENREPPDGLFGAFVRGVD
jgi:hypothetical protein